METGESADVGGPEHPQGAPVMVLGPPMASHIALGKSQPQFLHLSNEQVGPAWVMVKTGHNELEAQRATQTPSGHTCGGLSLREADRLFGTGWLTVGKHLSQPN